MKKIIVLILVVFFLVGCQTTPSDEEVEKALAELSNEELQELSEMDLDESDALVGEAKFRKRSKMWEKARKNPKSSLILTRELTKRKIVNKEDLKKYNQKNYEDSFPVKPDHKEKDNGEEPKIEYEKEYTCKDLDKSSEPFSPLEKHAQKKLPVLETIKEGMVTTKYKSEWDYCNEDVLTEYYCTKENKMENIEINCLPEGIDENGCFDYDHYDGCDDGKCVVEIGSSKCIENVYDLLEEEQYKSDHCISAYETSKSVKIIDGKEYVIKFLDIQAPPPMVSFTLEYEDGSEYFTNKVGNEEETLEDGTKVIISEISLGENSATICIE